MALVIIKEKSKKEGRIRRRLYTNKKIEIKKPFNSISLEDAIELIKCDGNPDEDRS